MTFPNASNYAFLITAVLVSGAECYQLLPGALMLLLSGIAIAAIFAVFQVRFCRNWLGSVYVLALALMVSGQIAYNLHNYSIIKTEGRAAFAEHVQHLLSHN